MKKVFFSAAIIACFFAACTKENFLDQTTTTDLNEETVFSDSARSMDFLANIYSGIGFSSDLSRFNGAAGLDACSDEAEGPLSASITTYNQFATGAVSAYSIATDAWSTSYTQIRAVNQFLHHLPTIPFNDLLRKRTQGEALFLRAWYYDILLKHYGGIPLVGDTIYTTKDKISTVRNTYEECVNYITAQCDAAAALLPTSYSGLDYGRITKGACLALKARVLLYAASPLFNGGGNTEDASLKAIVGYPVYNANRWKLAADAARAVMDLGAYSLHQNASKPGYGFYELFQLRKNEEYILARMNPNNKDLENLWRPPSRGGSTTSGSFPYQNLVDAFEMGNGKAISDPESGYDPANPYANRDPRLNYTVTHNLSSIYVAYGDLSPVYTYDGEPNGDGFGVGTPTGYYGNKMCSDDVVPNYFFHDSPRCLPLMRFADILLMYAEAMNEWGGPTQEVYEAVEAIRQRAGLNPYQLPTGLSQDAMRNVIQHERRVEFAFETQRFWDVRRWKIAEQTDTQMMTGMRVKRNADGTYTYMVVDVRKHSFRPAMYLWPIPQSETAKSTDLVQNPGY
ncbi:RagB/SusD family nutrient uptake outer membrane protein [Ilyomonas limi]|uniref:RagB/SusD family nutrient uptake outer membrane protein n=1 Tax=Ilyomonas limi TaxID=2575867 RepID=A0A4U3L163_9BACT|nr:RagB/SusD family nutrient uptake outer membrane protein [Ilyomonas limi]TKK67949.1 RagB/SusD family nutrient uptake outer membrane protein [Ilyomonas limi]